ncbi:hypothetical protein [Candidatus Lokiarchaeum ossiferum]|uniref:hypothetical protein n=1 Tax=Candidatus Lokiarchaeum ossiferum TaxID=2951803 RepID=UPI00352DC2E3
MTKFDGYKINSEIIERSGMIKEPMKVKIPVFGYQEWKHNYIRDEEGKLDLIQTEVDFIGVHIEIFNKIFHYIDVPLNGGNVSHYITGEKVYYYRISQLHPTVAGHILIHQKMTEILILPRIRNDSFTYHIEGVVNQGYADFDPILTSNISLVSGLPGEPNDPSIEDKIEHLKNHQLLHQQANGGNMLELLAMVKKMDENRYIELKSEYERTQKHFQRILQKEMQRKNGPDKQQQMNPRKSLKTLTPLEKKRIRQELRERFLEKISMDRQGRKCRRCNREGIPYYVEAIQKDGSIAHSLCICAFCSQCILKVRKDHPHNVYIPAGMTSKDRKEMINAKIEEIKER